MVKRKDQAGARSELERIASSLVEEWPAVVAVYPLSWPELKVPDMIEVRFEGICGVLALRRVV